VASVDEAAEAAGRGFARLAWSAVRRDGEARLAAAGATVRCLQRPDGTVPDTEDEDGVVATVARAY
jgi:prolyl-tRNA synthetase